MVATYTTQEPCGQHVIRIERSLKLFPPVYIFLFSLKGFSSYNVLLPMTDFTSENFHLFDSSQFCIEQRIRNESIIHHGN